MDSSDLSQDHAAASAAKSHRQAGRFDDAEALVAEALVRHPDSRFLLAESAAIAQERGDFKEAARRWRLAWESDPNWIAAAIGHNAAQELLANQDIDTAPEGFVGGTDEYEYLVPVRPDADRLREMFVQFESLGHDCSFGFAQRLFGAEPLGLFRWSGISSWDLVRALNSDLKEISEAADARLLFQRERWYVTAEGAGFEMHAHVKPDDPEGSLTQMRRRMRYLSGKMLEDLHDGEKVFVFVGRRRMLKEPEINAIHAAVRRHGPGRLLCICAADHRHPPGTLEARDDGLWLGRVQHGAPREDIGSWIALCSGIVGG